MRVFLGADKLETHLGCTLRYGIEEIIATAYECHRKEIFES